MWQSAMVINLTSEDLNQKVTETFASTLGIVISFVSVAASIAIATLMDYFRKKMKLAICILLASSGLVFILCTLITEEVIIFENQDMFKGVLSSLLVLGVSLSCSCAPIAFEFCVELSYPIAEGTIGKRNCKFLNSSTVSQSLIYTWNLTYESNTRLTHVLVFEPNVSVLLFFSTGFEVKNHLDKM